MAVKFQQWVNAFDSTTVEAGCSTAIDSAGIITSTIASANDANDQATQNITTLLPAGEEGSVRFYFTVPSYAALGNLTFFHVENAGSTIVELYLLQTLKSLAVFGTAGRVFVGGINSTLSSPLAVGSEHLVEFSWRKNGFVRVKLDGVLVFSPTGAGAASTAVPTLITVGIHHYDNADAAGATMRIRNFQLSDNADDILIDPLSNIPAALAAVLYQQAGSWQLVGVDSAATGVALDAKQLAEIQRAAIANYYECRYSSGLIVVSPRR